jgi:hypothetical protein
MTMSEAEIKLEKLEALVAKLGDVITEAHKILRGEKTNE